MKKLEWVKIKWVKIRGNIDYLAIESFSPYESHTRARTCLGVIRRHREQKTMIGDCDLVDENFRSLFPPEGDARDCGRVESRYSFSKRENLEYGKL
jgi:hypothetical protein